MRQLKKFSAMCAMAMMAFGCTGKYNGFVLKGTYAGGESPVLYMYYTDTTGNSVIDSTVVESGKFEFRGGINEPGAAQIWKGDRRSRDEKNFARLFIEPATMQLSLDETDFSKYVLTGSPTNDLAVVLEAAKKDLYSQMGELRTRERASTDDAEIGILEKQLSEVSGKVQAINLDFIKNHPSSILSAYNLRFMLSSLEYPKAVELYDSLTEEVRNGYYGKQAADEIERKGRGEPGQKARLFVRTDINGDELNLPELNKDHYLLVDFWASWCVPCRRGNPHLKELYKKYGPMGLIIVCVSDDDSNPDKWREAVQKDGIGEFRHVLRGFKRTADGIDRSEDLSENFGNSVLPTKYLIDKNGIIIFKCTEDTEALDAKLKEIFGK